MHVEQVQFDEVFDVAASGGDFGYRSGARVWYGVHIEDGAVPRPGSRYAIAFAEPGNWATVLGWRDLAQPTVTLARTTSSFLLSQAFLMVLYAPFFIVGALVFGGTAPALGAGAAIAAVACYRTGRVMRRNRAVKRALLACAAPAPAAGEPA